MGSEQPPVRWIWSSQRWKPGDPATLSRSVRVVGSRPARVAVSGTGALPRPNGAEGAGAVAGRAVDDEGAQVAVPVASAEGDGGGSEAVASRADPRRGGSG